MNNISPGKKNQIDSQNKKNNVEKKINCIGRRTPACGDPCRGDRPIIPSNSISLRISDDFNHSD